MLGDAFRAGFSVEGPTGMRFLIRSRMFDPAELAGLGLAASLGVGGALVYALQNRNGGNQGQELYSTDNRSTPDGLAGLPKDYTGVPKLGPPLPGDLGRPILNAQNGGPSVPTPGGTAPAPVGPSPEEQRRTQELEAARTAHLFASTETRPANTPTAAQPSATATPATDLASLGLAPLIVKGIFEQIKRLNKEEGLTVFLVEQNAFAALKLSDRAYVMVNGKVTMSGTGRELLADPSVRAAYLEGGHH